MRPLPTVLATILMSAPAAAAGSSSAIDLSTLPARCRAVAEIPRSAQIADPAFSAQVSAATCVADVALGDVLVIDSAASIQALDAAIAPVMATLDEVVAHGTPNWQIVAHYWKGNLLLGLQVRVRSSIPPIAHMPLEGIADIERRHRALEPKLERWGKDASAEFRRVAELAQANPQVAQANPAIQYMVREAVSIR
jgi:hypothetical protein